MRKPFENKKVYDPGRLRHVVKFLLEDSADNGSGGSSVVLVDALITKAGKEKISQYNQMALQAGASVFNGDAFFIIRNRAGFYPLKTMKIEHSGDFYTIEGVVELDDPCTYIQLLCVRSV